MKNVAPALLLAFGLAIAINASADPKAGMYRWKDENGTLQYSDRPPEGVESEFVTTYGGTVSTEKASEADTAGGAAKADKKEGGEAKAGSGSEYDKMEVLPEKDPALCKQARDNLKALEGARIRITEPDGSKRLLNDDERDTQKANARKVIDMHC